MIYTTLNKIRVAGPCGLKPKPDGARFGLCKLMHSLGKSTTDDEPVGFDAILRSNGLEDALWCLRTVPEEWRRWRKLAVQFARTVQHLMTDPRSLAALDVAQAHADGLATDAELAAAWAAAQDAAQDAAWAAAQAAVQAARAAQGAAWDAAWGAAWDAALAAAWGAAGDAAQAQQTAIFLACLEAP